MPAADGLLVVDKPAGWTSHDVVARSRRMAATRKVGHAGTLDPMATGVLLLGIGRATRLLGHLALTDKSYDATIRLGQTTVTDDAEGDVVATSDTAGVTSADVEGAVAGFRGELLQVPSSVSAVKIDGRRAYRRVRAGEDVLLPPRRVQVSAFTVQDVRRCDAGLDVDVAVTCSSGTYVRALARDVGGTLGVGGHLIRLRRTRVGPYDLDVATALDRLTELEPAELPVRELDQVARDTFATYDVRADDVAAVRNGRPLPVLLSDGGSTPVAMMSPGSRFLALYEQHGHTARAIAVFAPA